MPTHKRKKLWERDRHECVFCGGTVNLSLEMLVPEILGGQPSRMNLSLVCLPCQQDKVVVHSPSGIAIPEYLQWGRFHDGVPVDVREYLTRHLAGDGVDWRRLDTLLRPIAKKVHHAIYNTPHAEISIEELFHEGIIAIVEQEYYHATDGAIRVKGKRAMWDFAIRLHRHVTLPKTQGARSEAIKELEAVVDIDEHDGTLEYEDMLILGLDIRKQLRAMTDRPRQLWLLTLMGYTVQEIADMTGLKNSNISVSLSKNRLVPRTKRNLPQGATVYSHNSWKRSSLSA